MKILLISHFFRPEIGAGSIRVQYLVRALKEAKHEVKVITPIPNYPSLKQYNGFKNKKYVFESGSLIYLPIYIPKSK